MLSAATLALGPGLANSQENPPGSGPEIEFETLLEGSSAVLEPGIMIIGDQEALTLLYEQLGESNLPQVDFAKNIVVGVFEGEQPRGGFDLEVEEVLALPEGLAIFLRETIPGSACLTTQAISAPFEIVSIPKISQDIFFAVTPVIAECI